MNRGIHQIREKTPFRTFRYLEYSAVFVFACLVVAGAGENFGFGFFAAGERSWLSEYRCARLIRFFFLLLFLLVLIYNG
jgi:hypothetical protein